MTPPLRIGVIARADDRGLGVMTWELVRHLAPDRVLVVREPGAEAAGFAPHLDRYPDATVVTMTDSKLPEDVVRGWLDGLDVVYSAETYYDWRLPGWAREAGCSTVLHVMPEFYRADEPPDVDAVWVPTPWRLDQLPPGTRVVPVPVATDRLRPDPDPYDGPMRVLHVVGRRAAGDRNGTTILLTALRYVRHPIRLRMVTQDPSIARLRAFPRHVDVELVVGGVEDYWGLYGDSDVLVLPRRYGGLSLPVQEAMASGLAVVMPECPPNDWWPTIRVRSVARGVITTSAGNIPMQTTDPRLLARTIDGLAGDTDALNDAKAASELWAAEHSWIALAGLYRTALAEAAA